MRALDSACVYADDETWLNPQVLARVMPAFVTMFERELTHRRPPQLACVKLRQALQLAQWQQVWQREESRAKKLCTKPPDSARQSRAALLDPERPRPPVSDGPSRSEPLEQDSLIAGILVGMAAPRGSAWTAAQIEEEGAAPITVSASIDSDAETLMFEMDE